MFLPHSLFHCLVHIQFSSLLVQEANPLHSQELDTALLPSAARIPRPHSAGSGCTTIQHTGVKLPTAHKYNPPSQPLSLNLSHITKSSVLMLTIHSVTLCLTCWVQVICRKWKFRSVIKWGVTLKQLTSYTSFLWLTAIICITRKLWRILKSRK